MGKEIYTLFNNLGLDPFYSMAFLSVFFSLFFIRKMKKNWKDIPHSMKSMTRSVICADIFIVVVVILRVVGIAKF